MRLIAAAVAAALAVSGTAAATGASAAITAVQESPAAVQTVAVPSPLESPAGVTRFGGVDRYATAAAVSSGSFPGGADDVFIVTGANWPDALAAGAAAARTNAPVLPVTASNIPAAIDAELTRLNASRAWVIGGSGVVDESVVTSLTARGLSVQRVSGDDRYATAAAVATRFFPGAAGAYYASGAGYADALAGGAAAAHRGWPLLLTAPTFVPAETPVLGSERILLGGTGAVNDTVLAALGARRIGGADRYATAALIARDAFASAPVVYIATGLNFPDALAGTPAAYRDGAPLLLAARGCVTQGTRDAATALGITAQVALGGTSVVSDAAAELTVCAGTTQVEALLAQVTVAGEGPRTGYDRDLFVHWITIDGCTVREHVLIVESVTTPATDNSCALIAGSWTSAYDAITTTDPSSFDIDHMVPLAEAWDSGAAAWTAERRRSFANDLGYAGSLIAVSASSNRSKQDSDPAEWVPTRTTFHCTYATDWVRVKLRWELSADSAEMARLRTMLATCPGGVPQPSTR